MRSERHAGARRNPSIPRHSPSPAPTCEPALASAVTASIHINPLRPPPPSPKKMRCRESSRKCGRRCAPPTAPVRCSWGITRSLLDLNFLNAAVARTAGEAQSLPSFLELRPTPPLWAACIRTNRVDARHAGGRIGVGYILAHSAAYDAERTADLFAPCAISFRACSNPAAAGSRPWVPWNGGIGRRIRLTAGRSGSLQRLGGHGAGIRQQLLELAALVHFHGDVARPRAVRRSTYSCGKVGQFE